jgi:hypothetical protein
MENRSVVQDGMLLNSIHQVMQGKNSRVQAKHYSTASAPLRQSHDRFTEHFPMEPHFYRWVAKQLLSGVYYSAECVSETHATLPPRAVAA